MARTLGGKRIGFLACVFGKLWYNVVPNGSVEFFGEDFTEKGRSGAMKLSLRHGFWPSGVIFCAFFTIAAIACAGSYSGETGDPNDPFAGAYSGGSGTADDPYKISTFADWQELTAASAEWQPEGNDHYILLNDIDFGGANIRPMWPVFDNDGNIRGTPFRGIFDGNGHVLRNAVIATGYPEYTGLFGYNSGQICNLTLENFIITGWGFAGSLVGLNYGTITSCHVTGSVTSGNIVGGLVGWNIDIGNEHLFGTLSSSSFVGFVRGDEIVGGLVGQNYGGSILSSCADGSVKGSLWIGGLCGYNGYLNKEGIINSCYATATVSGLSEVGGLCGANWISSISQSFATGMVSSGGGLCGLNHGVINGCFWDTQTSGQTISAGGEGKTTAEMKALSTFTNAGWDFVNTWAICDGTNYPRLKWQIPATDWVCPDGVAMEDLVYLAERWMASTPAAAGAADGNGDGRVDLVDLATLSGDWGKK
jgi:hypothetical protein